MTEKRQVRGLLDMLDAERSGEPWEREASSPDFVPGMGLGATAQATRWARIGMQLEMRNFVERAVKRPVGRPASGAAFDINKRRAFALWGMVHMQRLGYVQGLPGRLSTRALIGQYREIEDQLEVPNENCLFGKNVANIEESVSRGRKRLNIDKEWNSEVCEKIWADLTQITE